jgi:hypothetical protein
MIAETASAAVNAFWYARNSSSLRMIMLCREAIPVRLSV